VALTATLALGIGGSLAFATAGGAAKKHPKSSIETPSAGTVVETGSTLLYPLFNLWSAGYGTKYPSVTIQTAGTGSGTGITKALTGLADIGASDGYLAPTQLTTTPSALNIPLAISAQLVVYDLPEVTAHLALSGMVLSQIYQGKITTWNDPAIAALNPSVTLPSLPIVTLHRAEGSWDTFLFSTFLSDADPNGWGKTLMFNTTIAWPTGPGAVGETGNSGMVAGCKAIPGCIAYVAMSYQTEALLAGLGYAAIENAKGQSELPTPATVAAEAASARRIPANGTQSLIYLKASGGYPIVNFEYAIVNSTQTSTAKAKDIRSVLEWAINPADGNNSSYLAQINFQPLPATVEKQSLKQIATIQ
jgi:phosphate transport system substrate-binding protein